ncbi:MAG: DUF4224 domain-containing protein [Ignavibacteriaceae bacterium]|nr:DUF4224 domain-containing protein [Ignavibacteriaceae bacterium]
MNKELISFEDLQKWYKAKRANIIMQRLRADNIPFRLDQDGKPITTATAVNDSFYNRNKEDWSEFV